MKLFNRQLTINHSHSTLRNKHVTSTKYFQRINIYFRFSNILIPFSTFSSHYYHTTHKPELPTHHLHQTTKCGRPPSQVPCHHSHRCPVVITRDKFSPHTPFFVRTSANWCSDSVHFSSISFLSCISFNIAISSRSLFSVHNLVELTLSNNERQSVIASAVQLSQFSPTNSLHCFHFHTQ